MGNQPSHPSFPLDGYSAVRASIEARFPPLPSVRPSNTTSAAGCWGGAGGELEAATSGGRQQEKLAARLPDRSNGSLLLEQAAAGSLVPPALSVAETTDTNSDGAPDEFEAAASSEDILGGLPQSFTRSKAPRVRAQSPLPFPSMGLCSPTASRKAENHQQVQPQREVSSSSRCSSNSCSSHDDDAACSTQKVYAVSAFPTPSSRPRQLDPALVSPAKEAQRPKEERTQLKNCDKRAPGTTDLHATGAPLGAPETHAAEAPHGGLAEMCAPIVKGFEASCGKYLSPVGATVKLQALHITQGNGVRLDWVITAKVLPPAANHVLSLGYCFKYRHPASLNDCHMPPRAAGRDKAATDFFSCRAEGNSLSRRSSLRGGGQSPAVVIRPPSKAGGEPGEQCRRETPMFSVAVAPAGSKRRLWLHRDMCRFHGDETGQAELSHLGPVCVGDFVEVPVVLSNGIGTADVSTIHWLPISVARRVPRVLSGPKAFEAACQGLYEGCGLEMQYPEWFDADRYRHMTTERLKRAECMEPQLHHESTAYSGIDLLVWREPQPSELGACSARWCLPLNKGLAGAAAQRAWGLQCKVVPPDAPIVFPLTRKGLLHDRSTSLQLRVGDILESYLTIGGADV
ncbi:oxidoreductase, putative [Eimeria praecox]|uniref:Oxidoreductase, putative n=1 Tax=Eimeria praecox TaxID=51316 RepID=U6G7M0_9EIME|nr:oxidoreductase, putative [Eimeria praecox]